MVELILPRAIYNEIVTHAREGAPEEVCGILSGKGNVATALYRARNVAPSRLIDYTVDDQTLLRQFEFEERGEAMVAIYHSHPESPAFPSATDARQAFYPDAVHIICSLMRPDRPFLRAYRLVQAPPRSLERKQIPPDAVPLRNNLAFLFRYEGDRHSGRCDLYDLSRGHSAEWIACDMREVAILVA
jgi:proteasome lid subunit RPN8/RPN11